jgi:hypothetical protein
MAFIRLQELIEDYELTESYILFRNIEDWCLDNIPRHRWRFDYSHTLCVCGIDLPGRIFFWSEEDEYMFRQKYKLTE